MRNETWRSAAALGTWLVVGVPELVALATNGFSGPASMVWLIAFAVFGLALIPCVILGWPGTRRWTVIPLLVLQTLAGLTMTYAGANGTESATLVIVAAEVAAMFSWRVTWIWVAVQSVLIAIVWAQLAGILDALAFAGAFAGFQAFAASTVALARTERVAREALTRVNAELVATRSLLTESSRASERIRIARDLHDTLGHHLTALSIQLDVASRMTPGPAATHVRKAHAIARLLLSDVRNVVSEMRDGHALNLAAGIRALAGGAGALRVHLDMPASIDVEDAARAQALLRCVQEIITNATRHAAAGNLWIQISSSPEGIGLLARDDGRGAARVVQGHGLNGMRERFEAHAGRVEFASGEGRGFEVRAFMPRAGAAS